MRPTLLLAVLLLGCAGSRVETRATTRQSAVDRSSSNPTGEETEYSTSLSLDPSGEQAAAARAAADANPLLASDGSGFHWVRAEEEGFVRALGKEQRWKAPAFAAARATLPQLEAGTQVFVARVPGGRSPTDVVWQLGTVERVDPVFQKVYVDGKLYDAAREVLIPVEPVPEAAPAE